MAFVTYCNKCQVETLHCGGCLICKKKEIDASKEAHLFARSKMSIEERLTLLEAEAFDHKIDHPVKEARF